MVICLPRINELVQRPQESQHSWDQVHGSHCSLPVLPKLSTNNIKYNNVESQPLAMKNDTHNRRTAKCRIFRSKKQNTFKF